MGDREEAQRLLSAARRDLKALVGMQDVQTFADEIFGFHAQQAIEKALKAWLAAIGAEYPKSHDISLLLSRLWEQGLPEPEYIDLLEFNPYAVQFRYDAFDNVGTPLDRQAVIHRVTELIESTQRLVDASPSE